MVNRPNWLLVIFLVISLCFNLFFVGAYLYTGKVLKRIKMSEGIARLVAKQLDLSKTQQEVFLKLRGSLQSQAKKIKQANYSDIEAFWQEIVKDSPDSQKIDGLIEKTSVSREEFIKLTSKYMQEFLRVLTPKQRKAFMEMRQKRSAVFQEGNF